MGWMGLGWDGVKGGGGRIFSHVEYVLISSFMNISHDELKAEKLQLRNKH